MSYYVASAKQFAFMTPIGTGAGNTTLVAAPGANRQLAVQSLTICITTSAAQAFDIESADGVTELFKAPASLAVGLYGGDAGRTGVRLPSNTALQYTATAGVGLTVSGFGWVVDVNAGAV